MIKVIDFIIYWSIVLMPFSVAIAPGIANTFIGLFAAFFIIKKIIEKKGLTTDKKVLIPFACLLVVSLLSFINSVSYNSSFGGIIKLLKYLLIFVVCSEEVRDKKHIQRIAMSVCCGISLMAIDAFWQFVFGYDFIHGINLHNNVGVFRASASFPDPNVFGVYMTALTPLIAALAIMYTKGKIRLLMIFSSVIALGGVVLTFSRGAGLAILVAVVFLCITAKKKLLIALLLVAIIIFPFVMPSSIRKWAKEVNYNPVVFMLNQDRISIYSNTVNMIKHHPFIGVGINTFSKNYAKYKTEAAEKYCPTPDTIYSHNIFLQMAGETGLLGLAAFLWFLFAVFQEGVRAVRKLKDEYLRAVALGLIACVIAFLVNGLTETSLYYARVSMVFWFVIGVLLSLRRLSVSYEK